MDNSDQAAVAIVNLPKAEDAFAVNLTITDITGATSTETVIVTVNATPIANAGLDQIIALGDTVSFNGNNSTDKYGNIVSVIWSENGTPLSTNMSFSISNLSTCIHNITLEVTNNVGASAIDTIRETIVAPQVIPPVAEADPNQNVAFGNPIELNGGGSYDSDGEITSYLWSEGGVELSTNATFIKDDFSVGDHILSLTVTDNNEASASDTVTITVTNAAPTTNAGPDQTITLGDSVTLDGSKSEDSDGTIQSYAWTENGTLLTNEISFTKANFTVGTHTIILTVTDNDGATDSDTVIVTVNAPPTANAGADQTIDLGDPITLNGSNSEDNDGTILSYTWHEGSSLLSNEINFTKANFTAGQHTLILTVTDNKGATSSDTVTV